MNKTTKVTLTVDLYEVPTVMRRLLTEAKSNLNFLLGAHEDIENMFDNSDYHEAARAVVALREKLFKIDSKCDDLATLLVGYVNAITELQEQEQENEQQGEEVGN